MNLSNSPSRKFFAYISYHHSLDLFSYPSNYFPTENLFNIVIQSSYNMRLFKIYRPNRYPTENHYKLGSFIYMIVEGKIGNVYFGD